MKAEHVKIRLEGIKRELENLYENVSFHVVQEEKEKKPERAIMYRIVYEQYDKEEDIWFPSNQLIEASDVHHLFSTFGYVLKIMQVTARNIRYGTYSEMEGEMELQEEWWRVHREQKTISH